MTGEIIIEDPELLLFPLSLFKLIIAKGEAFPGILGKVFPSSPFSLKDLTVEIEVRNYLLMGFSKYRIYHMRWQIGYGGGEEGVS